MRLAFYSPRASHLEPALAHGGDPIFLHALFGALSARGHEVKVVSRISVRDLRRGRGSTRRIFAEARAIRAQLKQFAPHGLVVYNPSPTHPDLFGWWQPPPRYLVLSADTWQSRRLKRPWRWLFAFAFRRSLRRAVRVTAARPAAARRLAKLGASPETIEVVPPGVMMPSPVPDRVAARSRLALPPGTCLILAVTRFTGADAKDRKTDGVVDLLRVVRQLPADRHVVVVGDGPGRSRVEGTIHELGLRDRVHLPGAVEHDELVWWFAACDLYAYPDPLDRPRVAVLEAQASGRPAITLRSESAELTVDEGRTGLLARDLEEFRSQLLELTGDSARREAMGLEARRYVLGRHSIEVRAREIEEWLGHRS